MGRRTRKRARLNPTPERTDVIARDDEPRRPLWPFFGAFAIFALVLAYIFLTGERGDPGPTNAQKIRTLTEQYVAAHNAGDTARMKQLSCAGFADSESPLNGDPKGIAIDHMRSESPEPGVADAEVTLTLGDKSWVKEFWYTPEGAGWLVCRKTS